MIPLIRPWLTRLALSSQAQIAIAATMLLAMMTALIWQAVAVLQDDVETDVLDRRHYTTIGRLREVQRQLTDAETSQRGYLIVGDAVYLAPYHAARTRLPLIFTELRALLGDDPLWGRKLDQLAELSDRKLGEMQETLRLLSANRRPDAMMLLRSNLGQHLMEEIRLLVGDLVDAEENAIRLDRRATADIHRRINLVVSGFVLIGILAGAVTLWSVARQRHAALRANAALAEARDAALSASQAKSRFLAAASHDLRQPLHALTLFVSALERRVTEGDAARIVADLKSVATSMNAMFNALLDVTRMDAGAITPQPVPVDLGGLLARLAGEYRMRAAEKGLIFRHVGTADWVRTDPEMLESILRNFLSNAIKFTSGGGILLGCRRSGDLARIEIIDTGPGMTPGQLPRVFEEFERLGRSRASNEDGLGLGLSIARRMARLIGSDITVRSQVGRGTCFALALPRIASPPRIAAEDDEATLLDAYGYRILIVDDDHRVLAALRHELADLGFVVATANGAAEAWQSLDPAPDAILMDLNLGGDDGVRLAQAIRAHLERPIPVAIISGATDPETIARLTALRLPWLTKPVEPALLHQTLDALISES